MRSELDLVVSAPLKASAKTKEEVGPCGARVQGCQLIKEPYFVNPRKE
jgi:hypothetical protein